MPEQVLETPISDSASAAEAFAKFIAPTMDAPEAPSEPKPEAAPPPKPEAAKPAPEAKPDDLPEQFLKPGAPKPTPAEDFDKSIDETPKGQITHANFKAVQDKAKAEVARLRTELETVRGERDKFKSVEIPESAKAELEALRKEKAELTAALEKADYQNSPTFRAKFSDKENTIRDSVKGIGKEYGVDDESMAAILASSGKHRDGLVDALDITDGAKRRLDAHLTNLDVLAKDREADLGRARESLAQERQREQQAAEDRKARESVELKKISGEALKTAAERLNAFKEVEGNAGWNAKVQRNREAFEHAFLGEGLTQDEAAEAYLLALDHPVLTKINQQLYQQVQNLTALLEKSKATDTSGGNAPAHTNGADGPNHSPQDTFHRIVGPTLSR